MEALLAALVNKINLFRREAPRLTLMKTKTSLSIIKTLLAFRALQTDPKASFRRSEPRIQRLL